jgi:proteasome alpha subunit
MLNKDANGGYDRSLTMFSPEGRLYQVEYALESVRKGTLAVGIKSKNGACVAVHKKLNSQLMDPDSVQKIFKVVVQ